MTELKRLRWALGCALMLLLCVLISRPYAEIGIVDDWSYVRTTQIFAKTGHLVYNGWAAPLLGWQAVLGAIFARLFGPSFTSIRMSMLVVAAGTALVLHRVFVRFGATEYNATVGTIALLISPLGLPLAATFHTDMPAAACILTCLYGCARALRAKTINGQLGWLLLASTVGDLGGTNRQIAWLAALVFVPVTGFLLRRRKPVLFFSVGLFVLTLVFIATSLHWLLAHPHTVPEKVLMGRITGYELSNLEAQLKANLLSLPFYLFPLLVPFAISPPRQKGRALLVAVLASVPLCSFYVHVAHRHLLKHWLLPCTSGVITRAGALATAVVSDGPELIGLRFALVLTLLCLGVAVAFLAWLVQSQSVPAEPEKPSDTTLRGSEVAALLVPFALAYFCALLPRALFWFMLDRYLFPIYIVLGFGLVLLYQRRVQRNFSGVALGSALLFAGFGTLLVHDLFALQRAKIAATNEIMAAGVPRSQIEAGFEFDSWTQILNTGYVTDYRMAKRPAGEPPETPAVWPSCALGHSFLTPTVHPRYLLSYDPHACAGLSRFPAVTYKTWMGPSGTIYVVAAFADPARS